MTHDEGMSTADPPDVLISPTRGSTSLGETRVLDGSMKVCVEGVSVDDGSTEKSPTISNLGVANPGISPEKVIENGVKEKTQVVSNLEVSKEGSKNSWVGVVQGQKVLKKYDVEIQMQDGIGSVMVPEEITKGVAPLWDDFLIGKFLDVAPHIAKVHAIVNKIWTLNDKAQRVEVFEVNETMMKFRILNNADKNRVLRRGMWNIAGVPVVLTKWSPVIEKEKPPTQSIPMWVHIKNVPVKLFSWQGLSFVTSPLGSPVRLHPETTQCLNIEVAKIFVKVDLSKDLPKKMKFNIEGEEVMVEYIYPWLPTKCPKCEKWGHTVKRCPQGNEEQSEEKDQIEEGEIREVQSEEKVEKEGKEEDRVVHMKNKEEEKKFEEVEENTEKEKELEWSEITPGKASRSPNMSQRGLEYDQVSLITESRFSVLSPEEGMQDDEENVEQIAVPSNSKLKEKEEVRVSRQVLPRDSKLNHRYLGDKGGQKAQEGDPSYLKKKKSRR